MNDQWVTPSEMNIALGNKPGSSGFRTIIGRFPELRDRPYRRSSRPGEPGDWLYNKQAVLYWDAHRPGKGNRTPGYHGTSKENANV